MEMVSRTMIDLETGQCGKDVFRKSEISDKVVGDICPCVLSANHDGDCRCEHMIGHQVDAMVYSLKEFKKLTKGL